MTSCFISLILGTILIQDIRNAVIGTFLKSSQLFIFIFNYPVHLDWWFLNRIRERRLSLCTSSWFNDSLESAHVVISNYNSFWFYFSTIIGWQFHWPWHFWASFTFTFAYVKRVSQKIGSCHLVSIITVST